MIEVKSSNLAKIGYDEPTSTLKVEFRDGQEYWYNNVPKELHTNLMKSESIGKFFVKFVKGGNFPYKKIPK
jgi:KTSC domain